MEPVPTLPGKSQIWGVSKDFVNGKSEAWVRSTYDPLHDDAQAMALVKKMELSVYRTFSMHSGEWRGWGVESKMFVPCLSRADNADLNRAICECVAKMMQAKGREG